MSSNGAICPACGGEARHEDACPQGSRLRKTNVDLQRAEGQRVLIHSPPAFAAWLVSLARAVQP